MIALLAGAALAVSPPPAHRCAPEAKAAALRLLQFHYADGENPEEVKAGVGDTVRVLRPVRALKGPGVFDVLEVAGHVYKADFRIRLIYARIPGACVLMGQEIFEISDPY